MRGLGSKVSIEGEKLLYFFKIQLLPIFTQYT